MEIFVVGVNKNRKKINGFKVLCIGNNNAMETRDVSYDQMIGALQSSPQMFKNIKLENGEPKGVNGSLDRYGECGKSQALVIINEIKSPSGQLLGYFCADALGRTKELSESDAIGIANSIGIANGKLVPDTNGKNYISCIEGSYKSVTRQQTTPAQPTQQVSANTTNANVPAQNNTNQLTGNLASLSENDKKLITELRKLPNFNNTTSKNIIDTIARTGNVSSKQRYVMISEYEKLTGKKWVTDTNTNNVDNHYEDAKKLIEELKTYKEYKDSFAKKIGDSVEKYKKCSEKQKAVLEKELEKLKSEGAKPEQIPAQPMNQVENTKQEETPAPKEEEKPVENVQSTPQTPVQTAEEKPITPAPVNNALTSHEEKKLKEVEAEKKKALDNINEMSKLEATKQQRRIEGRRMGQNIQTDGIFDYSLHKDTNGRQSVYIEGFHKDVDTHRELNIPETAVIGDRTYRITGIALDAFAATHITSLTTSSNIEDIGQGAFRLCIQLETVNLSASKHRMIARSLFAGCVSLESINMGSGIQRIHEMAFEGCVKLKEAIIPEDCKTLARNAFANCYALSNVVHSPVSVNLDMGAFSGCSSLKSFDFTGIVSIGAQAFRYSGLEEIVLSGSIRDIGDKAFADCFKLYKVTIEEGVETLGEYVFAKSASKIRRGNTIQDVEMTQIEEIYAPKSLKAIGADTFRNAAIVIGYTGTVAESKCIAFRTPFRALDSVNDENSTRVRQKSTIIGVNPIEALKKDLALEFEGASNPEDFEMHTNKLLNNAVGQDVLNFLKIDAIGEEKAPHVKFKGAVNYLQDIATTYKTPLTPEILRLSPTFDVINTPIYDDGYNRISKITYEIMDTLESGSFIIVLQGNKIQFICDCNLLTDLICTSSMDKNIALPIKKHLHSGDIIGENSTIDGNSAILVDGIGTKENVGKDLYLRMFDNGIDINTSKKDEVLYVPAAGVAVELHDRTKDKLEEDEEQARTNAWNAKYRKEDVVNNKAVLAVMNYDEFVDYMKHIKKSLGGYTKFFNDLAKLSSSAVNARIKNIGTIEDEKEGHLFAISKQFVEIVDHSDQKITPNLLTYKLLNELAHSYWIISKDENWYRSVGAKSLNKTAEYFIGQYKLTEYKSNQIVKFSNPYMNGCKGAYVFTLVQGNNILGVYTSRYNMQYICEKLYDLTYIEPGVEIPDAIMQNPRQFDTLDSKLFYPFYDVMQSKNGWSIGDLYATGLNSSISAAFNISMYKPTGVFYLTMSKLRFERDPKNPKEQIVSRYRTTPILPIGNMDRALVVATTTNTNSKKLRVYKELLSLAAAESTSNSSGSGTRIWKAEVQAEIQAVLDNYYKLRELILAGVKDVAQYKKLVDSRVVYMVGTIQKGQLQREDMLRYDYEDEDDIEDNIDTSDFFEDVDMSDIEEPEDIEIDDIELEEDSEEFDLDEDGDEEETTDNKEMAFEEFFELTKSMGVTDEQQARAMYISFLNQNK